MMQPMRTTVTLDPDTEALIKRVMAERDLSFKEAINQAIRDGLTPTRSKGRQAFPVRDLGEPLVDLTHALRLADQMEDQELSRKLAAGK
jgi:hypothetical protein